MNRFMDLLSPLHPPGFLRFVAVFSFWESSYFFAWSRAHENKRMNQEEAENPEVFF